jgi:UDP-N-acetylglucosamine 2-epimerase
LDEHSDKSELSGNIDGMTRHAIGKLVHMHLASNEDAAQRLIKLGEEKFRVFNVGAPQIDEMKSLKFLDLGIKTIKILILLTLQTQQVLHQHIFPA